MSQGFKIISLPISFRSSTTAANALASVFQARARGSKNIEPNYQIDFAIKRKLARSLSPKTSDLEKFILRRSPQGLFLGFADSNEVFDLDINSGFLKLNKPHLARIVTWLDRLIRIKDRQSLSQNLSLKDRIISGLASSDSGKNSDARKQIDTLVQVLNESVIQLNVLFLQSKGTERDREKYNDFFNKIVLHLARTIREIANDSSEKLKYKFGVEIRKALSNIIEIPIRVAREFNIEPSITFKNSQRPNLSRNIRDVAHQIKRSWDQGKDRALTFDLELSGTENIYREIAEERETWKLAPKTEAYAEAPYLLEKPVYSLKANVIQGKFLVLKMNSTKNNTDNTEIVILDFDQALTTEEIQNKIRSMVISLERKDKERRRITNDAYESLRSFALSQAVKLAENSDEDENYLPDPRVIFSGVHLDLNLPGVLKRTSNLLAIKARSSMDDVSSLIGEYMDILRFSLNRFYKLSKHSEQDWREQAAIVTNAMKDFKKYFISKLSRYSSELAKKYEIQLGSLYQEFKGFIRTKAKASPNIELRKLDTFIIDLDTGAKPEVIKRIMEEFNEEWLQSPWYRLLNKPDSSKIQKMA